MPRSHESNEDHAARVEARKAALARAAAALTPQRNVEGPPHVYWPRPAPPAQASAVRATGGEA